MTTAQTAADEKLDLIDGYISSFEEEPALTDDEKKGIHTANLELARGEGRPFKEAMNDLW